VRGQSQVLGGRGIRRRVGQRGQPPGALGQAGSHLPARLIAGAFSLARGRLVASQHGPQRGRLRLTRAFKMALQIGQAAIGRVQLDLGAGRGVQRSQSRHALDDHPQLVGRLAGLAGSDHASAKRSQ
jgi:hypothetical protein